MKKRNIILAIVLFIIFISIVILLNTGTMISFDNTVYNIIHSLYSKTATSIFKIITFFGSTIFIVLLAILLFIVWKKNRGGQAFAILIILSTIVNNVVKLIIKRPRPEVLRLVEESTYSFPSGHTMAVTTLVGFLIYYIWQKKGSLEKKKKIILTILLILYDLLVMISRIYLGAHFASDVIGAVICSSLVLIIFIPLVEKVLKKYTSPTSKKE